jgi:cytosine/adenosine deaminase-related metal-dependent hydrolase
MPSHSCTVTGHAFLGDELRAEIVSITVEKGIVRSIEPASGVPDHWIIPAFFNAHTHCGDTVAMDCPCSGSLTDLVTPPDGLKHRILAETPRDRLVSGMRASIEAMLLSGTAGFADFREGGVDGVAALREAAEGLPCRQLIFGRDGGELEGHGLGISSVRDVRDAEQQVARARAAGKLVAFHAGERDPHDIDDALAFDPDLLVHCTHATDKQLRECAERDIPIAICARSNWILGIAETSAHPPVRRMLALGCRVYLGTDNVMFVQPDLFGEMAFISSVYRVPPDDILRAAVAGSELTGQTYFLEEGKFANFTVIDARYANIRFTKDPIATVVRRLSPSAIEQNVLTIR